MSERPIQEEILRALNIYRDAMRLFIVRRLRLVRGDRAKCFILKPLNRAAYNDAKRALERRNDPRDALDIGYFDVVINYNWHSTFKLPFKDDRRILDALRLIGSIRNEASHPPFGEDIDRQWAMSRIHDIVDILERIGATDAKGSVQAIWDNLDAQSITRLAPEVVSNPLPKRNVVTHPPRTAATPQRNVVTHSPRSVVRSESSTYAGWIPLSELKPAKGSNRPSKIAFPDGSQVVMRTWKDVPTETARWLINAGILSQKHCPIRRSSRASLYIANNNPVHGGGRQFTEPRQVGWLHLETFFDGRELVEGARMIIQRTGQDASQFKVQFG